MSRRVMNENSLKYEYDLKYECDFKYEEDLEYEDNSKFEVAFIFKVVFILKVIFIFKAVFIHDTSWHVLPMIPLPLHTLRMSFLNYSGWTTRPRPRRTQ